MRGTHSDGTARLLELTHTNLCHDPSVRGVVINVHDTTERRAAEHGQAQLAEQFRVAFENAPVGMAFTSMQTDTPGQFLRVNEALARMLGRSREQLEGVAIAEITHADDIEADTAAIGRFQTGEATTFETEKRYQHADGHYVWVHLRATLMTDEDGGPDYAISQMVDITERRAAEVQLATQALHDPLTGLPNRRMLFDRLAATLELAPDEMAILYLDLDQFKVINDSYGHHVGDEVLVSAARRLAGLLTERETLARFSEATSSSSSWRG